MLQNTAKKDVKAYLSACEVAAQEIDQKKNNNDYSRKTIHEINNSLAKINNALWLMAREESDSTSLFVSCREIIERELAAANKLLKAPETALI